MPGVTLIDVGAIRVGDVDVQVVVRIHQDQHLPAMVGLRHQQSFDVVDRLVQLFGIATK